MQYYDSYLCLKFDFLLVSRLSPASMSRLEEEGLPVPRSWAVLKHQADIYTGSCTLDFGAGTAMDVVREVDFNYVQLCSIDFSTLHGTS